MALRGHSLFWAHSRLASNPGFIRCRRTAGQRSVVRDGGPGLRTRGDSGDLIVVARTAGIGAELPIAWRATFGRLYPVADRHRLAPQWHRPADRCGAVGAE
jgi:hypothetical protein